MFNDRYGLTAAVLQGRKTMTRRIVPTQYVPMIEDGLQGAALIEAQRHGDAYRENEIVAVAQSYKDARIDPHYLMFATVEEKYSCSEKEIKAMDTKGWSNKMFVRADLMPHQIQITDINIVRLQDISEEDCLKEGIKKKQDWHHRKPTNPFFFGTPKHSWENSFPTAKKAFATLINRPGVGHKGLWEENPFVFAYSFQLIK